MQIQVNTANNINGHAGLASQVRDVVENALSRFGGQITRIEVHLSDENGGKGGKNDKRCVMEARLEGRQPFAVTDHADTVDQAIDGATEKLVRSIDSTIERMRAREG